MKLEVPGSHPWLEVEDKDDVWDLHVSFVFNLRPRMEARHLQLHLTSPTPGWELGTSSFVIPLWLPSSQGRRARHHT